MRHRATFLVGLAAGLVAGMRLGQERYDQLKSLAQKVIDSPAVQKAAKAAGHQAADKLPKLTETAKTGAGKVISQFNRSHDDDPVADPAVVNGAGPPTQG